MKFLDISVSIATNVKINVFWDVMSCSLIDIYQFFENVLPTSCVPKEGFWAAAFTPNKKKHIL